MYDALFLGAGPAEDGTLEVDRVAENLQLFPGVDSLTSLAQWLYDYAAFALFDVGHELPRDDADALNQRVADRLALLAPKG